MVMSNDAAVYWAQCLNEIESKIAPMCFFSDIKDGASKIAENISRIACIFQTLDFFKENSHQISVDAVQAADAVCSWYISQFKLIFGDFSVISEDAQNANELMMWLERIWMQSGHVPIRKNSVRQLGPNKIRKKDALDRALNVLQNQGKIWISFSGIPGKNKLYTSINILDIHLRPLRCNFSICARFE
jgi:hypothetical protein